MESIVLLEFTGTSPLPNMSPEVVVEDLRVHVLQQGEVAPELTRLDRPAPVQVDRVRAGCRQRRRGQHVDEPAHRPVARPHRQERVVVTVDPVEEADGLDLGDRPDDLVGRQPFAGGEPGGVPGPSDLPNGWSGVMAFSDGIRNCVGYRLGELDS